jgi:hypothetical protein
VTTTLVPLDTSDALAAGQTMRSLAALDRCGSADSAALFARVGAQLVSAAELELAGSGESTCREHTESDPVAATALRAALIGRDLTADEALAAPRVLAGTCGEEYRHQTVAQLARALVAAHELIERLRIPASRAETFRRFVENSLAHGHYPVTARELAAQLSAQGGV